MPEFTTGFPYEDDVPNMTLPRGADRNVRFSQGAALHPSVAPFVKNQFKYPPDQHQPLPNFNNEGIAHFAKLLVSSECINHIARVWNLPLGEPQQSFKLPSGSVITTSPEGCHFPGTDDRIICVRGETFDEIAARCKEILAACVLAGASSGDGKVGVRIAVPRRVVGTVIGRGGSHIQTLRQMTQATIHISPLFVTSEYACSERVISISSKDPAALQHATLTLLTLINKHPERASCQRTYYRNGAPAAAAAALPATFPDGGLFQMFANP